MATSANAAALGRVRTTLAWQHRTWFFEALAAAALGLAVAALALGYLRHTRRRPAPQRRGTAGRGATRATRGTRRAQTPSGQQAGTSVPPQASGTGQVGRE